MELIASVTLEKHIMASVYMANILCQMNSKPIILSRFYEYIKLKRFKSGRGLKFTYSLIIDSLVAFNQLKCLIALMKKLNQPYILQLLLTHS